MTCDYKQLEINVKHIDTMMKSLTFVSKTTENSSFARFVTYYLDYYIVYIEYKEGVVNWGWWDGKKLLCCVLRRTTKTKETNELL